MSPVADRAEQRVRNRMREDIRIGVAVESTRVRNFDSAEDQFSALTRR